ncbi:acyl-CoA dehydrogenase family protein [Paenarthrobacter sp. RAF54_2]|uniref:acyl-CoA dehydrogenase family protein n=1 Tax=Paenarthrobacter sp. RAF54_2 TaxID=3233061 RepID=UPI003F97D1F4
MESVIDTPICDTTHTSEEAQRWVDIARSLAPLVESEVPQADQDKVITSKVVQAWKDAGLYGVLLPKHLGGAGVDAVTYIQIAEEISRQDASAGWVYGNHQTGTLFIGMLLPAEALRELIGPKADGVACGSGAPQGPFGTAKPVDGGYLVKAPQRFFGSGSQHATRVVSRVALLNENDEMLIGEDGEPNVVFIWVDPEHVEWKHDWDPSGLAGSGSGSYLVKEHVIEEKWMAIHDGTDFPDDPVFTQGFTGVTTLHHVGTGLGLAKRAIEEMAKSAQGRRRGVVPSLDNYPLFQAEFVRVASLYQASRAFILDSYKNLWEAAAEHRLSELHTALIEQAALHLYRSLDDIIATASLWAGSDVIAKDGIFARLNANARVAMSHLLVGPQHAVQIAPALLDDWLGSSRPVHGNSSHE